MFKLLAVLFCGDKNKTVLKTLMLFLTWGGSAANLTAGYLTVYLLWAVRAKDELLNRPIIKNILRAALLGISALTGNIFLIATVGKAQNFKEMAAFFTASGYAIWFLYFIMTAETLGALGILLHFKLKTGPLAAAGLILIMTGAVYTHWHNNDPFSDSYAAVIQLLILTIMMIIYYQERLLKKQALSAG